MCRSFLRLTKKLCNRYECASCRVCGEVYHVNDNGQVQCNGSIINRCLVYHPEQNSVSQQIADSISFHSKSC